MLNELDITEEAVEDNRATYCPADNKIRLYLSARVERDSYEYLRKIGFQATPKQDCSFAGVWSIKAEDAAFDLIPDDADIEDEDYSPEDRAADRAERFSGYRDKRRGEASGLADRYDSGEAVYGNQNIGRAERQARRRDRVRDHALSQWSKAEYWQVRTQGVIRHALHRQTPAVRRGRILTIEAEIRKVEASYTPDPKQPPIMDTDRESNQVPHVWCGQGRGGYWLPAHRIEPLRKSYARYLAHLHSRLIYENAMLENEGGKASDVGMVPGGFLGRHQILKVNKSAKTGRVVSVAVWGQHPYRNDADGNPVMGPQIINVERFGNHVYREPTEEELAKFNAEQAEAKKAAKASKPKAIPLLNPTPEDAERLQRAWHDHAAAKAASKGYAGQVERLPVLTTTQAIYSSNSKGSYALCETRTLYADGRLSRRESNMYCAEGQKYDASLGEPVCKIRIKASGSWHVANRVILITDKPQKPLPVDWAAIESAAEPVAQGAAK